MSKMVQADTVDDDDSFKSQADMDRDDDSFKSSDAENLKTVLRCSFSELTRHAALTRRKMVSVDEPTKLYTGLRQPQPPWAPLMPRRPMVRASHCAVDHRSRHRARTQRPSRRPTDISYSIASIEQCLKRTEPLARENDEPLFLQCCGRERA